MGKIQVDHRIVVRDQNDHIISDQIACSFVVANPIYEAAVSRLERGQTVTLQHGARIIRRSN